MPAPAPRSPRATVAPTPTPPPPVASRRAHPAAALLAALAVVAPPTLLPALAPPPAAAAVQHNVRVEDVSDATLRAGLEAANDGDFVQAERAFAAVISRDGPTPSLLSNLAQTRLQLGRPEAALRDADAAVALAPAPAVLVVRALAHEALAVAATARGDAAAADGHLAAGVADCDAALAVDPTDFTALFDRGGLLQRLGRYGDAAASFARAADAAPGLAGYRARHAELLFQTGDAAAAARELRAVVRRAPTFAEARAALAAVAWSAGDVAAAEAQLAAAQSLDGAWGGRGAADGTRWPPALVEAYQRLVDIK